MKRSVVVCENAVLCWLLIYYDSGGEAAHNFPRTTLYSLFSRTLKSPLPTHFISAVLPVSTTALSVNNMIFDCKKKSVCLLSHETNATCPFYFSKHAVNLHFHVLASTPGVSLSVASEWCLLFVVSSGCVCRAAGYCMICANFVHRVPRSLHGLFRRSVRIAA